MEWSMRAGMRCCIGAVGVVGLSVILAQQSESVTESEALRLFLEGSPQTQAIPLAEQSASAGVRANAVVENPALAYQIEDAAGARDEFLTFQQPLPITGRRGLVKDAAEMAAQSAGLTARRDRTVDAYLLKDAFCEVLYRQLDVERLAGGEQALARVVEILRRREAEGEASGYDLLRAEQELAQLQIETARAAALLAAARARFGSFFDPERHMEQATLVGELKTAGEMPDTETAVATAWSSRTDLQALAADEQRYELNRRTVVRRRLPEPTLMAGWKRTTVLGLDDTGFAAALSVPLPIFDRGQVGIARATADRDLARLQGEQLRRQIRAEVLAALAREQAAREVAEDFDESVEGRADELRRIAQLRYDEGEGTILELLDAHRTALTLKSRALAARYQSRRAEIERNRIIGIEVVP